MSQKTRTLNPSTLKGTISPPPSKSISHRALILAAFSKVGTKVENVLASEDVRATRLGLEEFGAEFRQEGKSWVVVRPITREDMESKREREIDCLNSGTTLRLLTGIAALFQGKTTLTGDQSLVQRPMQPLIHALKQLGAEISSDEGTAPLSILRPIDTTNNQVTIAGDSSSQYISSLLLLAALRKGKLTTIELLPPVVSKPYIELTLQMLEQVGSIISKKSETILEVTGSDRFEVEKMTVPADFSSVAFFAVAGSLPGNSITIGHLDFELPQADSRVLEVLRQAGAKVEVTNNSASIQAPADGLKAFEVDLSQSPDIFPILCVLAACASGKSKLYNAKHLRIKETDRITTMLANLEKVGIAVEELEDGAIIKGGSIAGNSTLDSYHDHRIAMASAILASQAGSSMELANWDCVDVSYPTFYEDLEKLTQKS